MNYAFGPEIAQILSCDYSVVFVQFPPFLSCMLCTLALCSEWVSGCEFSRCLGLQDVKDFGLWEEELKIVLQFLCTWLNKFLSTTSQRMASREEQPQSYMGQVCLCCSQTLGESKE